MKRLVGGPGFRYVAVALAGALPLGVVLAFSLGLFSRAPRTVRYGTYVSQLCEAIGPFEADSQRFGRVLGKYTLALKSPGSRQQAARILTALDNDSRHVLVTLKAAGAPEIRNGQALAAGMIKTFRQIAFSDFLLPFELSGRWVWPNPAAGPARRQRWLTSIRALLQVGRQFETLPETPERQDAMARSPVCREVFGAVRFDESERNQSAPVAASSSA